MTRQFISAVLLSASMLAALSACSKKPESVAAVSPLVTPVLELLPSDVKVVSVGNLTQVLTLSGSLRPMNQASVKAKVAGEVKDVLVREGEPVQKGQMLAQIEQSDYLARVAQAKANLHAAEGQLEIAINTRKNNQQLQQQKFISKNALETSESQFAIAQANVAASKAALDVANKALQDTKVFAPIAGIVSSRNIQPGEKISPDARLLDVVDLAQMEMEVAVPSFQITQVKTGLPVKINFDGVAGQVLGRISRITPSTQSGTRSILMYAKIENREQNLRAGMFGQASVLLSTQSDVVKVPTSALYFLEGEGVAKGKQANVYVIDKGILRLQPVVTGRQGEDEDGAAVEVTSGLSAGAQIIKVNLGNLNAGIRVNVSQPKPIANKPSAASASSAASNR